MEKLREILEKEKIRWKNACETRDFVEMSRISQVFREILTQKIEESFEVIAEFFEAGVLELLLGFLRDSRNFCEETVMDNVFWVFIDCAMTDSKEIADFYYESGILEICEAIIYKESSRTLIKNVIFPRFLQVFIGI